MYDPDDPDLPDELRGPSAEDREAEDESAAERLAGLGRMLAGKLAEAKKARTESGVEGIWQDCEDAYAGIDPGKNPDGNNGGRWRKPTSMQGGLQSTANSDTGSGSTVFIGLTQRYVDMAAAKAAEFTLPIDDRPFEIKPTPIPDMAIAEKDERPLPQPVTPAAMPGQPPGMPVEPAQTVADVAKATMARAQAAADKAADWIDDRLAESRHPRQMRRLLFDAARLGTGVLKGPFADVRTRKKFVKGPDGQRKLTTVSKTVPATKAINPWDFFPGPGCGEDIHDSEFVFERDHLSESKLRALKKVVDAEGKPIYLNAQIDRALEQGPGKSREGGGRRDKKDETFEVWYFTGALTAQNLIDAEAIGAQEYELDGQDAKDVSVFAQVMLVNDVVIRANFNPLESGNFGYRVFRWLPRADCWYGKGPGEQVAVAQKMVNAGVRSWMNNAGISAGVQIAVNTKLLQPADASYVIGGGVKLWLTTEDGAMDDVRKAFSALEIPNRGDDLIKIVEFAFKLAEEQSNIPLISQGQTGAQDPQTFGQAEMQNTNANTLLRQVAQRQDDDVIEPVVEDFYEWLMLDPDVPEEAKGDFDIVAQGSQAMVEKAIQEVTMTMLGGMTLNPAYGLSPKRWAEKFLKAKRIDPEGLQLTEEEKAQMQAQQPPPAPAVQAAQIRAEADAVALDKKIAAESQQAQADRDLKLQISNADTDRDTVYQQAMNARAQADQQHKERIKDLDFRVATAKLALDEQISLDEAKTRLTERAMSLRAQMQLSADGKGPQVAEPAVEPEGRAPEGQAFER